MIFSSIKSLVTPGCSAAAGFQRAHESFQTLLLTGLFSQTFSKLVFGQKLRDVWRLLKTFTSRTCPGRIAAPLDLRSKDRDFKVISRSFPTESETC